MADLINRYYAKDYLQILDDIDDGVIENLVTAASAIVEKICDRTFATATYKKWIDGNGEDYILVPDYPITAIDRVCLYSEVGLKVECSQSDATRAIVGFDETNVSCKIVGGAEAGTNEAAVATYATLTTLKATIDAFTGWAATIRHSETGWASNDIKPVYGLNALTPDYAKLLVPDEAETWIDSDMERTIYLSRKTNSGRKNVFVEWTGGYSTIPETVKNVCARIVGLLYHEAQRDPSLQSERLGDYSWTARIFPGHMAENVLSQFYNDLKPYMKSFIA